MYKAGMGMTDSLSFLLLILFGIGYWIKDFIKSKIEWHKYKKELRERGVDI